MRNPKMVNDCVTPCWYFAPGLVIKWFIISENHYRQELYRLIGGSWNSISSSVFERQGIKKKSVMLFHWPNFLSEVCFLSWFCDHLSIKIVLLTQNANQFMYMYNLLQSRSLKLRNFEPLTVIGLKIGLSPFFYIRYTLQHLPVTANLWKKTN